MHLSERQAHIAEMLHQADIIRVEDLSRHFQVTTQTIRRDLNFLCEHGLARRVHGGIQRVHTPGNMAAKDWTAVLYLDERADPTQREALTAIFSGQAGGHPQ